MNKPYKQFGCEEAKELMGPVLAKKFGLTCDDLDAFETHLHECFECRNEYLQMLAFVEILESDKLGCDLDLEQAEPEECKVSDEQKIKAGWQDLLKRCPDLACEYAKENRKRNILRYAGLAAGIMMCVIGWLVFSGINTGNNGSANDIAKVNMSFEQVSIQLISYGQKINLNPGEEIATGKYQTKELLINGNRNMLLNSDTRVIITPMVENGIQGCEVNLLAGEIYTHVEHDGKPFIVKTEHGNAVITGTTFNVKLTDKNMQLVVTEGLVRLENQTGSVNVPGGMIASVTSGKTPASPAYCDTASLTAWANNKTELFAGLQGKEKVFAKEVNTLKQPIMAKMPDLDSINYDKWIENNRSWFKTEFPWIFKLQEILAQDGIKVDYPELLAVSGDLQRFNWPPYKERQLLQPDRLAIETIAKKYGITEARITAEFANVKQLDNPEDVKRRIAMLRNWQESIARLAEGNGTNSSSLNCLHGCAFLINTRTVAWLTCGDKQNKEYIKAELKKIYEIQELIISLTANNEPLCGSKKEILDLIEEKVNEVIQYEQWFDKN